MPFSKLHEEVAWQIEVLEVHRLKAPRNPSLHERAGILLGKQESRDSHLGSPCPDPNISDSSCSGSGFLGLHYCVMVPLLRTVLQMNIRGRGRVLNSRIWNICRSFSSGSARWDWGCVWNSVLARQRWSSGVSYWCFKSSVYFC